MLSMDNLTFLQNFQALEYSIMGDKIAYLGFASITFNYKDRSSPWNHALLYQNIDLGQLHTIEIALEELERPAAVYFESTEQSAQIINLLSVQNYEKCWDDSWMFHQGQNIDTSRFASVTKVETEQDLAVFLDTSDKCFVKDDPQNPYGELGDYKGIAKEAWHHHHANNRIEYFIVSDSGNPVAVSALTNFAGIGYISNVASLMSVRGQGFGKIATMYCVNKSIANGNNAHCLATEEGKYPNEFYKRIGFETKFRAEGYVKRSN